MYEAESPQALHALIDNFPLVQAHYAEYQIFPLAPHAAFMPKPDAKA